MTIYFFQESMVGSRSENQSKVVRHINKGGNYMIISIHVKESISQNLIFTYKLVIEMSFFNLINGMHKIPTSNIIFND